jgi:hypothetical protein
MHLCMLTQLGDYTTAPVWISANQPAKHYTSWPVAKAGLGFPREFPRGIPFINAQYKQAHA